MKIRRAATVVAFIALPLTCGLPAAQAEAFFHVETNAAAVHVVITQQPASSIITASLLDDAVSYAASGFDSGGSSEALAAPAFPGNLVVQGPELLCSQLFSCPVDPPDYPFLADASYPRRSQDTAKASGQPMGAGPFVVTPLTATAAASATANRAATQAGSADLLAGTPGAVTVGTSAAHTFVASSARQTVATVTASATDVTVAGVVHIAAVRTIDRVVVAAGRPPSARPRMTVSGVTVAGHAASIDDKGVHVDGAGGEGLSRQLTRSGVSIHTVGAEHHRTRTGTRSDAVGLSIDVAVPVNGVPYIPNPLPPLPPPFDQVPTLPGVNANGTYVGHITLGAVGAAAGVGTQPSFALTNVGPGSTTTPSAPVGTGTPPSVAPLGGSDLVSGLATPTPANPPSVAAPGPAVLRGFADLVSKAQIETLYAVLALGTLALFLGWRAAVTIRAGRSR